MIYTVTLNPSLDYIVSVDSFTLGRTNRTDTEMILPGGKGINVSTVLKNLGVDSIALGFVAGFTGREIEKSLDDMGVKANFIHLDDGFSRINFKLKSIEGTEVNGMGPLINPEAVWKLMSQLELLQDDDILFLSGSIPSTMPDDTYHTIMKRLQGKKIEVVVDATKELLMRVLEYHPMLIKPNHHELGEIFGVDLKPGTEVIPYGRKLQEMGARNVLISMAGDGAVLIAEDGTVYMAEAPEGELKNGVGAGDSMVAGFMAGWLEKHEYRHAFHKGIAAGSASAFSENLATGEEIEKVFKRVTSKKLDE